MVLEIKTTEQLYTDNSARNYEAIQDLFDGVEDEQDDDFAQMNYLKWKDKYNKEWVSVDSLIKELDDALSKTADISKIVAIKRIRKELEEDE